MLGKNQISRIRNLSCLPDIEVLDLHSNKIKITNKKRNPAQNERDFCFTQYNVNHLLDTVMLLIYNFLKLEVYISMSTVPTQVRIDANLKKQATELFSTLGMDMSGAMNIFLKQNMTYLEAPNQYCQLTQSEMF